MLLRRLHSRHGQQAFGRIGQSLLALSFKTEGYNVANNAVGIPDIRATNGASNLGFALEAKTSEKGRVTLSQRELKGLVYSGLTPTVAVLSFPDPKPQWHLLDARSLQAVTYDSARLVLSPAVEVGFDVNSRFRALLGEHFESLMDRPEVLDDLLR